MIRYDRYFLTYGMRRPTQVSKIYPYYEFNELPVGSILHLGMCINKPVDRETKPVPNPEDYAHFVTDKLMKFYFETSAVTTNLVVPFDLGPYMPFTSAAINAIKKFRNQTTKMVSSIKEMPFLGGYQGIVSYDPLYCGTITGMLRKYRMTTLVLDHMLTHVANNQEYDHFFVFKTENIQFSYTQFQKTFKVYDRISIMNPESAYYILLMNIIGFLHSDDSPSLFSRVSLDVLSKVNIIIANEDSNTSMHIRLDMLKKFSEKDPFIGKKLLATLNILSKTEIIPIQDVVPNKEITEIKADMGKDGKNNVTAVKPEQTKKEVEETIVETMARQDNEVAKNIAHNENLTPKQKKFNTEVSKEYKKIVIDNKPLERILKESSDVKVGDSDISKSVDIPDKSMTTSSITNFSTQYMEKLFGRDLISCLTSFSKHGMYLVDLKKEEVVDDLSELVKYTAKFKDTDGTPHTIKFTFPKIDANGNFKVNGSLKRMGIQRINTPICKVSPKRVSLSSCYNKSIVELNESFSNSLSKRLKKIFEKTKLPIKVELGTTHTPGITLPHEYSTIANEYFGISGLGLDLTFQYYNRFDKVTAAPLMKLEKEFNCVYIGTYKKEPCFMNIDGMLLLKGDTPVRLIDLLDTLITDVDFESYNEWVNFVILNKKFPIIFILAYRFGFEHILKYLDVDYEKVPKGSKTDAKTSDILIKTFDVTFVIKHPTTLVRFIVSGMNNFNLKEIEHKALEEKDAYYSMLQSRGYSIEYIRGIDSTFELFIDPITEDTLRQMHEPTNMKDLLIRAVVLLVTSEHEEAASATMFRYRTYEQMNAIMYKTLARAFATYRNKAVGYRNKFSISEFDVLKAILTDPLVDNVDTVNPIGEIKNQLRYTHIGDGGRTKEAMMIPDRRYPKDGMGSISEATVDSGKVGIDGLMSTDPTIINLRGLVSVKPSKDLTSTNILSPTALLFPGATMDDGKRANFISIQAASFLPVIGTNLSRVRTGYERVVAHRCSPPFAYVAKDDGRVVSINEQIKTMEIEYKSGDKVVLEWGEAYSRNSSGSFYVTQKVVINEFIAGGRFKKGDVIVYNDSFFSNDPLSKQVDMRLGLFENVALMDNARTLDDGCFISKKLNKALTIEPVQSRVVTISKKTTLHKVAVVGTILKSIDPLMIFDEADLGDSFDESDDTAGIIMALNKSIPKAKFSGMVVQIEAFYRCDPSTMSDTVKKFVKSINKSKDARSEYSRNAVNADEFKHSKQLTADKFQGMNIGDDDVIIKYFIQQNIEMGSPDKIVFGGALKSICSGVTKETPMTQDGKEIQAVMSASSVWHRMTLSPLYHGSLETIMEKIEDNVVDMYFN